MNRPKSKRWLAISIAALVLVIAAVFALLPTTPTVTLEQRIHTSIERDRPALAGLVTIHSVKYEPDESDPDSATVAASVPRATYFKDSRLSGDYHFTARMNFAGREIPWNLKVQTWIDSIVHRRTPWYLEDHAYLQFEMLTQVLNRIESTDAHEQPLNLEAELRQAINTLESFQFTRPGMARARILQARILLKADEPGEALIALDKGRPAVVANPEFAEDYNQLLKQAIQATGPIVTAPAPVP